MKTYPPTQKSDILSGCPLNMLLASWNFDTVFKRFRSFNAENLGSVDHRAAKLPTVKVGDLKKVWHLAPATLEPVEFARGQINHSQSLMASNFAALWSTEPKFSALKDLNLLKTVSKFQEASSILKVGFTLSKWPHFISYRGSCQNRSDEHCS